MQLIRNRAMKWGKGVFASVVTLLVMAQSAAAAGQDSAVVLLYHHVSEDTPASTSVTPEQFKTHMTWLAENYKVMPLQDITEALKNKQTLPENAVAVTFDDGYRNILENGHPVMQSLKLPYTVFINPDEIGRLKNQLSWDDVKAMHKDGVDFANHTLDHLHMLDRHQDESKEAWLERVWQNVEEAEKKLTAQTGESLKYLAYPFGEYNKTLADKLAKEGYTGFGQHSGGISSYSDFTALPRFPAAGRFANMAPLKVKIASLGMPVTHNDINNPERTARVIDETLSFTTNSDDVGLPRAACYYQGESLPVNINGKTLSYTLNTVLPVGRSRINCTAPSNSQNGRYYWFSQPFFISGEDGTYPD